MVLCRRRFGPIVALLRLVGGLFAEAVMQYALPFLGIVVAVIGLGALIAWLRGRRPRRSRGFR
jgi:hypothetical protein